MTEHFENVWEQAETFHKSANRGTSVQQMLNELNLKIELYKTIDVNTEQIKEEAIKIKSHLFGEILLTLANLSLIDDINTFEALVLVLHKRNVELYDKKYPL